MNRALPFRRRRRRHHHHHRRHHSFRFFILLPLPFLNPNERCPLRERERERERGRIALRVKRFRFHRSVCVPVADPSCPKVRLENINDPELIIFVDFMYMVLGMYLLLSSDFLSQNRISSTCLLYFPADSECIVNSGCRADSFTFPRNYLMIWGNISAPHHFWSAFLPSFFCYFAHCCLPTLLLLQLVPVFSLCARE